MKCFLHFLAALPFFVIAAVLTFISMLFVNSSELFIQIADFLGRHDHDHENLPS